MYGPPKELVSARSFLADRLEAIRDAYGRVQTVTTRAAKDAAERYDRKAHNEQY